ncbi:MAG: 23S rRNA (uracil-5-)-methyltransferase RumA, partial [Vallitaleaceae bacterium]|nr:23S rRNA (uracil-5-)-methyltransferase RumA [Vallitaleaceae bacterium]
MKQKDQFEGFVDKVEFPNKGIVYIGEDKIRVTNVIEGQKVRGVITKKRKGKFAGLVLEVLEKSPNEVDIVCKS